MSACSKGLSKVAYLGSAGVAEEFDLQSRAEAEAFSLADFDKPSGAGGECFHIDALGHEEDLV
jgi:hypothetical protein